MKFSDVTKEDMLALAQVTRMIHSATYPNISNKDIVAAAESLRWFRDHCETVAKTYAKAQGVKETAPPAPEAPAAGGLPAGVKIKSMGKAKK